MTAFPKSILTILTLTTLTTSTARQSFGNTANCLIISRKCFVPYSPA